MNKENRQGIVSNYDSRLAIGRVRNDNDTIDNLECKILLPYDVTRKPKVYIRPSREQYTKLIMVRNGTFEANIVGHGDDVQTKFISPSLHIDSASTKYWGRDIAERIIKASVYNLDVIENYSSTVEGIDTVVEFWLTANKFLSPRIIRTTSYDGSIAIKKIRAWSIGLSCGREFLFDTIYDNVKSQRGDFIQRSRLAGVVNINAVHDNNYIINEILEEVENLLLIASFASRIRTVCLGWTIVSGNKIIRYYRGNISLPSGECEDVTNRSIIDDRHLLHNLQAGINALNAFNEKQVIRGAIWPLVPGRKRILEDSYLSLYSGLETILHDYRMKRKLDHVVDKEDWRGIQKEIMKTIRNYGSGSISRDKRAYMYRRIGDINRIPIRDVYEKYCEDYCLDNSDLWPLFDTEAKSGLSDIRNKLIHGVMFDKHTNDVLSIAHEHLKWVLERMVVKSLRWNLEDTDVSPAQLSKNKLLSGWTAAKESLHL